MSSTKDEINRIKHKKGRGGRNRLKISTLPIFFIFGKDKHKITMSEINHQTTKNINQADLNPNNHNKASINHFKQCIHKLSMSWYRKHATPNSIEIEIALEYEGHYGIFPCSFETKSYLKK